MLLREACSQQTASGHHHRCQQEAPVLASFAHVVHVQTQSLCWNSGIRQDAALGPLCITLLCSETFLLTKGH